jgi:cytochrome c peroxidase
MSRSTASSTSLRKLAPFLLLPVVIVAAIVTSGFRSGGSDATLSTPLQVPEGWPQPAVPSNNPITPEKFVLGRYLFYEVGLSGDYKTSCGSCHTARASFSSGVGAKAGAFEHSSNPKRTPPRLCNLGYDSVYTWDGHLRALEDQVAAAIVKRGDFEADTNVVKNRLSMSAAYPSLFKQAFGTSDVTIERIAKAISTFERCLISANSPYDRYMHGETSAMTPSAIRGMTLFFDTSQTNCSGCHNNQDSTVSPMVACNTFTDNNYYSTNTFDSTGKGYGFDTLSDGGRFLVTRDSDDAGKFRTPTLRNVALGAPYGAAGSVQSLATVVHNYNIGGFRSIRLRNQDPRIKPLGLTSAEEKDIVNFLVALTDTSFITNPEYQDPGPAAAVADHAIVDYINVYPNPSPRYVTIASSQLTGLSSRIEARVIDSRGIIVAYQTLANESGGVRVDLGALPNGSYTIMLGGGANIKACKIVLEK